MKVIQTQKAERERKTEFLGVLVTATQRAEIENFADKQGLSISSMLLSTILEKINSTEAKV